MKVGSLFSGVGGLDLGLERAGMACQWQVEIDAWCRSVLAAHWPHVDRFADIRSVRGPELTPVDVIAGGFPCQDVSHAGRRTDGIKGPRSSLWQDFARLIGVLGPRFALVENVPGLAARGLDVVLGDLAALGFDAQWDCVGAGHLGAPHLRRRLVIWAARRPVPHAFGDIVRLFRQRVGAQRRLAQSGVTRALGATLADADGVRSKTWTDIEGGRNEASTRFGQSPCGGDERDDVAHGDGERCERQWTPSRDRGLSSGHESDRCDLPRWPPAPSDVHAWRRVPPSAQPALCLVADGLPARLVRSNAGPHHWPSRTRRQALKALGNAVVPPWAEAAGHALMEVARHG